MIRIRINTPVVLPQLRKEILAALPGIEIAVRNGDNGQGVPYVAILDEVYMDDAQAVKAIVDAHVPEVADEQAYNRREAARAADKLVLKSQTIKDILARLDILEGN